MFVCPSFFFFFVSGDYDVVLDAMFGFGFKGDPRPPFDTILDDLSKQRTTPVVSVDVPSGWSVSETHALLFWRFLAHPPS